MGGVATVPVNCRNYTTADQVDDDIDNYIKNGILFEAKEMLTYTWIDLGMYIWYVNT